MYNKLLSLLLLSLTTHRVSAIGKAVVNNNCSAPVFLWGQANLPELPMIIRGESSWDEPLSNSNQTSGRVLKIGLSSGPETKSDEGRAYLQFAYHLAGDRVHYSLSDLYGNPFVGDQVRLKGYGKDCGSIERRNGDAVKGSEIGECGNDKDVVLELCVL